ncbi:MAG TPA: hypothetical protein VNE18_10450 [Rhodanobacter sp.]|nr:hypothetical protein [Rhodanobacter sp.]
MASEYNLGQGLGQYFRAREAGPQVEAAAEAAAIRQRLQDQLLQGKAADQQASDAAYQAMPQDLETLGVPQGQGQAYADVTRATGSKANQLGQFFKTMTQAAYLKGAKDAQAKGDTLGSNFDLAAGGAHPLDYSRMQGGTAYNPNVTPVSQQFKTAPHVGATRSVIPLSDVNSKVFMQPVPQYNAIGKPIVGPDGKPVTKLAFNPQAYGKFNQWASDNGFNDMNAALPHYLKVQQAAAQSGATAPAAGAAQARATVHQALTLPPKARAALKEGVQTRFNNGQVWMLQNGVPKLVGNAGAGR